MDNILLTLLSNQNACFFKRTSTNQYQLLHKASWADQLLPGIMVNTDTQLDGTSLFLDDFIEELEQDWLENGAPILHSGIWSEQAPDGKMLRLEAEAFRSNDDVYLLIKNLAEAFQEKQKTLQAAREAIISNEQLLKEHHDSQDRLQALMSQTPKDDMLFEVLSRAVHEMDAAIIICDNKYNNIIENPAAKLLFDAQQLAENKDSIITVLDLLDRQYPNFGEELAKNSEWKGEICWVKPPFNLRWLKLSVIAIKDQNGHVLHTVFLLTDITRLKYLQQQNEKMEQLDLLTSLPNRQFFWRQVTQLIKQESSFYLTYFNVEGFKLINEEHGHKVGDEILIELAQRLKQSLKKKDVIARIGVDEFAIVLRDIECPDQCKRVVRRIHQLLQVPFIYGELNNLRLTLSIGVSASPKDGTSCGQLIKCASSAAKHAKHKKHASFMLYDDSLEKEIARKQQIESALSKALEKKQLYLMFQPIYQVASKHIVKLEALLRWRHPELGEVSPVEFIPIAEENGLIVSIGKWVIEQACKTVRELSKAGISIDVAVNISPRQFNDASLPYFIEETIHKYIVSAKNIELEITEGVLIQDFTAVLKQLQALKVIGVSLSVDDFGTGYSSLSYLKKLPIDVLKIDRSFVQDLASDENDKAIVSAVIAMAHKLNLKVIAEGVEDEHQLSYLKSNRCDLIQGFLMSKPIHASALLNLLTNSATNKVSKLK